MRSDRRFSGVGEVTAITLGECGAAVKPFRGYLSEVGVISVKYINLNHNGSKYRFHFTRPIGSSLYVPVSVIFFLNFIIDLETGPRGFKQEYTNIVHFKFRFNYFYIWTYSWCENNKLNK